MSKGRTVKRWIPKTALALLASAALALAAKTAHVDAGAWPTRTVNIVVAGPPGGGTDAIARIVAADFTGALHQSFIVDNRAVLHVPYRGSAPALQDLLGGQISMMFVTPGAAVPFLKSGQLRALAVTSQKRSRFLPEVPTVAELGYPGVAKTGWFGLFAPAGTPAAVVESLRTQLREAIANPQNRASFEALYLETAPDPATRDFPAFVQAESSKWEQAIQELGVTAE